MFARYAIPVLIASFALAAVISPGCDPCPKCVEKKASPTPTESVFPTATATTTSKASPTATSTAMPGAIGGAPVGAITVLVNGSYAPSAATARGASAVIGNAVTGGVTAYVPDGDYGNGLPNVEVVPVAGIGPTRASPSSTGCAILFTGIAITTIGSATSRKDSCRR